MRDVLARPMMLGGFSVAVDASVGLAVVERGSTAVTALRWADLAMNAAKQTRVGLEVYRPELDQADSTRLGLLADLRDAVAGDSLDVYYQPKVDLRTGQVIGVEALVRWEHPELGRVGPDEFIPLAEHSTLITPLTLLVLRKALEHGQRWKAMTERFSVAVNISPRSLLDPLFVDEVTRAPARVELPASALILEITETSLMADPERAIVALQRLREVVHLELLRGRVRAVRRVVRVDQDRVLSHSMFSCRCRQVVLHDYVEQPSRNRQHRREHVAVAHTDRQA